MRKRTLRLMVLLLAAALLLPQTAAAERGVGVTLGRIVIEDRLAPGGGYTLPDLGVINTGDERGTYEIGISYLQDQKQLRPPRDWFHVQPRRFSLDGKQAQAVRIRMVLPTGAEPGDYFALIEARMVAEEEGGVAIGAGAATVLSFSVKPSSWWQAQRVRLERYLEEGEPWTYALPAALLLALLLFALARSFRLRIERR